MEAGLTPENADRIINLLNEKISELETVLLNVENGFFPKTYIQKSYGRVEEEIAKYREAKEQFINLVRNIKKFNENYKLVMEFDAKIS